MKLRNASSCLEPLICARKDGIVCPDDTCDIRTGVIACTCEKPHATPCWRCPIHGDVAVNE